MSICVLLLVAAVPPESNPQAGGMALTQLVRM
jgi:hypothetical protein